MDDNLFDRSHALQTNVIIFIAQIPRGKDEMELKLVRCITEFFLAYNYTCPIFTLKRQRRMLARLIKRTSLVLHNKGKMKTLLHVF